MRLIMLGAYVGVSCAVGSLWLSGCQAQDHTVLASTPSRGGIQAGTEVADGIWVREFTDRGVRQHYIPSAGGQGLDTVALSFSEAKDNSLFEGTMRSLGASLSDLAECLRRQYDVRTVASTVTISAEKPTQYFLKVMWRDFYFGYVGQDNQPLPLDKRPISYQQYLTEPRKEFRNWYPIKGLDSGDSFSFNQLTLDRWVEGKVLTGEGKYCFARRSGQNLRSSDGAGQRQRPLGPVPRIKWLHAPVVAKGCLLVYFQSSTAKKLLPYAKKRSFVVVAVETNSRDWSQVMADTQRATMELEKCYGQQLPTVPLGFSAGGVSALNASTWLLGDFPGAVCDGHNDLANYGEPLTLRTRPEHRIALLVGKSDGTYDWAKQASTYGIQRKQPRLFIEHPGGHEVAPIRDYERAIDWVLDNRESVSVGGGK